MLIILDGPDGAGKTTLAKSLVLMQEATHRLHFDRHTTYEDYCQVLNASFHRTAVFDRSWASAAVYQYMETGLDRFHKVFPALELMAGDFDGVFVLCLPPEEVAMANWQENIPDEKFKDELRVRQFYLAWSNFRRTSLPLYIYDYTQEYSEDLMHRIRTGDKP